MNHFYTSCRLGFNTAKGVFEFVFSTSGGKTYVIPHEGIDSSEYTRSNGRLKISYLNRNHTRISICCSDEAAQTFKGSLLH